MEDKKYIEDANKAIEEAKEMIKDINKKMESKKGESKEELKKMKDEIEKKEKDLEAKLKELTKKTEAEILGDDKKFTMEDAKRLGNAAIKGVAKVAGIGSALLDTLRSKLEETEIK